MRTKWIGLLWIAAVVAAGASEEWPQFRGPTGDGHSDATGLPVTWSETENVRWKTPIPGEGWSSPVVLGNQIWLTTALEQGKSLHAVCVDRTTGKIIHNVEVFHVDDPGPKHELNSFASPTPVIEKGRVYVCFGTNGSACFDTQTAKVIWKNTELKLDHMNGAGSSPILYGNLFLLHCDGCDVRYVVALDKRTGKTVWKTNRSNTINRTRDENKAYCIPTVVRVNGHDELLSEGAYRFSAYEPLTGRELWWCDINGFSNVPRPVTGHGLVYSCSGFMNGDLVAIRLGGSGDVSQSNVAWRYKKNVPRKPSLLLIGDELYVVSDGGIATCLDARTGAEIWRDRIEGQHSASPVFADGRIYFFDQDGQTKVIKPGKSLDVIATNKLASGFMASPAIVGRAFYLRTKTDLYRIEKP